MSLVPKQLQLEDISQNNIILLNASNGSTAVLDSLTQGLQIGGSAPAVSVIAGTGNINLSPTLGNVRINSAGGTVIEFPKVAPTANGQYLAVNTDGTSSFLTLPSLATNPLSGDLDANGHKIFNLSEIDISGGGNNLSVVVDTSGTHFNGGLLYNFDNTLKTTALDISANGTDLNISTTALGAYFSNSGTYNFDNAVYATNFVSTNYNLEALGLQVANLQTIINNAFPVLN
jgi:hypothetical protein